MDADFVTNDIVGEDAFEADDNVNNDNLGIEGERCGICMDIVIDRGLLDCCQHWFCFVCIDNWATITNLCPLCQNEFQLITCVPVYDTIGSNKVEDDSFSRDDWSIEGKNNTLSFPSYYIDENAVICLDGNDCKIRSGPTIIEGDSSLDTSIACDSCDIWYHAFCVGFDPDGTSGITWLCPRCANDEVHKRTDSGSVEKTNMENDQENANSECQVKDSFSGKVSVSVADTGETAVVVSMVEGNQWVHASSEKGLSPLEGEKGSVTESCVSVSDTNNHQSETEATTISPVMEERELELSLSHNMPCSLPSTSLVHDDLKISAYQAGNESSSVEGIKLNNESNVRASPSRNESDMGLHLGLSVCSFLSVADMEKNEIKDQAADIKQFNAEEILLKGDEIEPSVDGDNAGVTGTKRKHVHDSDQVHTRGDGKDTKPEVVDEVLQKRIRVDKGRQIRPKASADVPVSDNAKKGLTTATVSTDDDLKYCPVKENVALDIMSIVKGTNLKISKGLAGTHVPNNLSKKQENLGLRVKKIMKRTSDEGESSLVVQSLRKEIREAVRNKSAKHFEENLFDPKLLAAFRAVIAGPKSEPVNKPSPLAVKAKKSMLQKGKVREHLTKKIFATSNGRRKRAWDRDCEIEFWKHRCMRTTKPEKIETLKSVLDLLRKSSGSQEPEQDSECQPNNTILSRLYLADISVFPRKDDVKPLSALNTVANSEPDKHIPSGKGTNLCLDNSNIKAAGTNVLSKALVLKSENKVDKKIVHGSVGHGSASHKLHVSSHSEGKSISSSGGSKVNSKELGIKSDPTRTDKRKWALEVLARKTAAASMKTENGNQDNSILKGNFPLLAQLPADMRPVLASSHHNKIPIAVRQTQLYRLTEHLLRKINLPVIRRTADTELAVADAINIEKEIADRSNSKLVYLNLCSQELMHNSNNKKSNGASDTNPPAVLADSSEQIGDELSTDPAVEVALKNAGLLSDSPPSSPLEKREICHDEDNMSGPDNIFELDSHPELDIYGDFEYDLEDEDYIGASVAKVSSSQEESESKMKLVFSTVNMKKSDIALDLGYCNGRENNEAPQGASCSSNCHSDVGHSNSKIDSEIGKPCVPSEPVIGEGSVEPFDAEFEELYGPDKEPLIKKFPEGQSRILHGDSNIEILTEDNETCNMKKHASDQLSALNNSSNMSHNGETVQRKEAISDVAAKQSDSIAYVSKKVEAYIKEHIRPLCKSGVITAEQYRWAVAKTTEKVMKYHGKAKNANFLIKEGEKVKKLAEQYLEAAQHNKKDRFPITSHKKSCSS